VILIAGGTGRLGRLVVRRLLDRDLSVRVLTRDPIRAATLGNGVEIVIGDVREPSTLRPALTDVQIVVSAVHGFAGPGHVSPATVDRDGNVHLIEAARAAGAQIVMVSLVGASSDNPMELYRMKYAAEQHLRESGVPSTVVAATAFMELWLELLEQTASRSGRPVVFGHGENPINFVSVDDVAWLVEQAVVDVDTRGTTLEIGGPEDLTFNQLAAAVQSAAGRSGAPRHLPPPLLRLLASTVGRVKPMLGGQLRAALAMDDMDLTFDSAAIRAAYPQFRATSLAEVLAVRAAAKSSA
jgi:uncharacterized protein YbjT (DUF2867 family)